MFHYIPSTEDSKKAMLQELGLESVEQLFSDISKDIRLKRELNLPKHKSELEVWSYINSLANSNNTADEYISFLGCGAYDHFSPAAVNAIISRSEFYTSYTPYQPEIAQGNLQTIFEFQSMICGLLGMDVANASVYDGSTAVYEATYMAVASNNRNEILISKTVHPEYREVLKASLESSGIKYSEVEINEGATSLEDLKLKLNNNISCVILQSPNFFGIVEDVETMVKLAHENKSLAILSTDPISMGLLKSPGEMGVDIAIGEAQCLGNNLSFGGPYLGIIASTKDLMRKLPGRIAGMTTDIEEKRGFVLTLQTREQHIKRDKAISNICSNQALNAVAATVYMALIGKEGIKKLAKLNYNKAHYTYEKLIETGLFEDRFRKPFFKEFALEYKGDLDRLNQKLLDNKIIGGFNAGAKYDYLNNTCIFAVTEKRSREDIDRLCEVIREGGLVDNV